MSQNDIKITSKDYELCERLINKAELFPFDLDYYTWNYTVASDLKRV